jgi:hypothetical protein
MILGQGDMFFKQLRLVFSDLHSSFTGNAFTGNMANGNLWGIRAHSHRISQSPGNRNGIRFVQIIRHGRTISQDVCHRIKDAI